MRKSNKFIVCLMAIVLVLSLSGISVFAASQIPDDAPYKDVVKITSYGVEISLKNAFDTDKLNRTIMVSGYVHKTDANGNPIMALEQSSATDVIVIYNNRGHYALMDLGEQYNAGQPSDFQNFVKQQLSGLAGSLWDFPNREIVSINGVPWQKTEWKDYITSEVKRLLKPSDNLMTNKIMWDVFTDPQYDGNAYDSYTKKYQASQTQTAADATGTPSNSTNTKKAILVLGEKTVTIIQGGSTKKVNTLSVAANTINGHTMIPLRGVLDEFGATLGYDGTKNQVTVKTDKISVVLTIGTDTALVNGKQVKMDQAVVIHFGRTLVPLRFVSESLGYKVGWDPNTRKVTVDQG